MCLESFSSQILSSDFPECTLPGVNKAYYSHVKEENRQEVPFPLGIWSTGPVALHCTALSGILMESDEPTGAAERERVFSVMLALPLKMVFVPRCFGGAQPHSFTSSLIHIGAVFPVSQCPGPACSSDVPDVERERSWAHGKLLWSFFLPLSCWC